MLRDAFRWSDSLPDELLSALADLAGKVSSDVSARDVVQHVVGCGVGTLGAAGGAACTGHADIVAIGDVPPTVADLIARGEESWQSSAGDATWPGALASVPCAQPPEVGGLAVWFEEARAFPACVRSFMRALGTLLARDLERARGLVELRCVERDRDKLAHWADVLNDAFRLISSRVSLKRIFDELARVSCETPADYSAIRILSPDRRTLEFRGLHHRDPQQAEGLRAALENRSMPADLGQTARVLETGESLLLPSVDPSELLRVYGGTPFGDYMTLHPVCSSMVVPLGSRGAIYGVVVVARSTPEPFQPDDLRFLQGVADRAAAALYNAGLLQHLAHSEQKLTIALEAGRLGAWEWDIPAGNVSWSTMLEHIHGLEPGTFPGTFEAFQHDIHEEDRDLVLATIGRTVEKRSDYHVMYRIIRPDGETRWVEAQGRLLCDPAGAPQRLIGVCLDVTERKRSDEQLRESVLALRDADQRKDQFLAMLAHELRNPLGPVLNTSHLLGIPNLDPGKARHAREILERQVQHMARLLDDLLDVSRISRGKIELEREPVDVSALIRQVAADHLESFRTRGLMLDVMVAAEPLCVLADRSRLAQIVGNLLSNALKFSERGQTVCVSLQRHPSRTHVVLEVRDQGAGIDPALLEQIFEPFVQAETSLSRPRGGLGLGLAVVKGLVELHGGRVWATSAGARRGTEVTVELPLHVEAPTGTVPQLSSRQAIDATSEMVLVFEDNLDAAESLKIVLSTVGYRVWVEHSGKHALDVVRRVRPRIVLCDIGLPDRDGYSIAEEIRSSREHARLPLIAISGYGSAEDQARARRAGFDLHLTKPVPLDVLLSELSHRLADSRDVAAT